MALHNKIKEQDNLISRLQDEQNKLQSKLRQFQQQIEQANIHESNPRQKKMVSKQQKQRLIVQLKCQIESAQIMLKNKEIQHKSVLVSHSKISTETLDELQNAIQEKRNAIKNTKQQIKDLQLVRRKQEKTIQRKKREEDGNKLTRLIEQVKKHRQIKEKMNQKNQKKVQALNQKIKQVNRLQNYYYKICEQKNVKALPYEQVIKKKHKQKNSAKINKQYKKPKTVKQIINTQQFSKLNNIQYNKRTYDQLLTRKDVALIALQNLQKKYEKQISQLKIKLQYIEKDHQILIQNLHSRKNNQHNSTSSGIKTSRSMTKSNYHSINKLNPIY